MRLGPQYQNSVNWEMRQAAKLSMANSLHVAAAPQPSALTAGESCSPVLPVPQPMAWGGDAVQGTSRTGFTHPATPRPWPVCPSLLALQHTEPRGGTRGGQRGRSGGVSRPQQIPQSPGGSTFALHGSTALTPLATARGDSTTSGEQLRSFGCEERKTRLQFQGRKEVQENCMIPELKNKQPPRY